MRVLLLVAIFALANCDEAGRVRDLNQSYDLDLILSLPEFDKTPFKPQGQYLIVLYFSDVDCSTCVNREVVHLKDLLQKTPATFDLAMVVHDPSFLQGNKNRHLRTLKRVGRLNAPIFMEATPGQAGLGVRMSLTVLDLKNQAIILEYVPDKDVDHWHDFETALLNLMALSPM